MKWARILNDKLLFWAVLLAFPISIDYMITHGFCVFPRGLGFVCGGLWGVLFLLYTRSARRTGRESK